MYQINEEAARRAKEANSFSDYTPGTATAEYMRCVEEARRIAEQQKKRVDPMYHEKIDHLLDKYCRLMAENINKRNEIEARVPSVLIAGNSNFPVRKKEKQNSARCKNSQEYNQIQNILGKIRSVGMGGVSSDDPNALEKLKAKLQKRETDQAEMKKANAYYRKYKTMKGYGGLTDEDAARIDEKIKSGYAWEKCPYPAYLLSNNNANIKRIKDRINSLENKRAYEGWPFDGGKVVTNEEMNRLQIFFEEKPDEEMRNELKSNGFRWAPSVKAWQRMLNDNAIYAAKRIRGIRPGDGIVD